MKKHSLFVVLLSFSCVSLGMTPDLNEKKAVNSSCDNSERESLDGIDINEKLLRAIKDEKVNPLRIKMLCQSGADANNLDSEERTPLHHAARYGNIEVIQALLEAGADATALDIYGNQPHDIAESKEHTKVRDLLMKALLAHDVQEGSLKSNDSFSWSGEDLMEPAQFRNLMANFGGFSTQP